MAMTFWKRIAVLVLILSCSRLQAEEPQSPEQAIAGKRNSRETFVSRHVKFLDSEVSGRYRYIDKGKGKVCDRDWQYKISTRIQITLDQNGTKLLQLRGESGRSFSSSWDYAGDALNKKYWSYNLKSLYYCQKLGTHWEFRAGGIDYEYGAGTEATHADNDGWLEGYRITFKRTLGRFGPDKIEITTGYSGDFMQPNFFARMPRMGDFNYVQLIASRSVGKNVLASLDWNEIEGTHYLREGVRAKQMHWRSIADELTIDSIARLSGEKAFGWTGTMVKHVVSNGRLSAGGFFSAIPARLFVSGNRTVFLNGDIYLTGTRIGFLARSNLLSNLELSALLTRRLDSTPSHRLRGQLALRYKVSSLLSQIVRQR